MKQIVYNTVLTAFFWGSVSAVWTEESSFKKHSSIEERGVSTTGESSETESSNIERRIARVESNCIWFDFEHVQDPKSGKLSLHHSSFGISEAGYDKLQLFSSRMGLARVEKTRRLDEQQNVIGAKYLRRISLFKCCRFTQYEMNQLKLSQMNLLNQRDPSDPKRSSKEALSSCGWSDNCYGNSLLWATQVKRFAKEIRQLRTMESFHKWLEKKSMDKGSDIDCQNVVKARGKDLKPKRSPYQTLDPQGNPVRSSKNSTSTDSGGHSLPRVFQQELNDHKTGFSPEGFLRSLTAGSLVLDEKRSPYEVLAELELVEGQEIPLYLAPYKNALLDRYFKVKKLHILKRNEDNSDSDFEPNKVDFVRFRKLNLKLNQKIVVRQRVHQNTRLLPGIGDYEVGRQYALILESLPPAMSARSGAYIYAINTEALDTFYSPGARAITMQNYEQAAEKGFFSLQPYPELKE